MTFDPFYLGLAGVVFFFELAALGVLAMSVQKRAPAGWRRGQ